MENNKCFILSLFGFFLSSIQFGFSLSHFPISIANMIILVIFGYFTGYFYEKKGENYGY